MPCSIPHSPLSRKTTYTCSPALYLHPPPLLPLAWPSTWVGVGGGGGSGDVQKSFQTFFGDRLERRQNRLFETWPEHLTNAYRCDENQKCYLTHTFLEVQNA